jgi:alanyl-tRNA synthetase
MPYPELEVQREFIEKMVKLEEERFGSTLTVGLNKLDEVFASTKGAMPEYKTLARSTTRSERRAI